MSDKVRLQILDIKEPSGVNLVDLTTATAGGYWFLNNPNWVTINKTTAAPFYRNAAAAAGADFFMYDIIDQNYNGGFLKPNVKYKLKFTVINYTQNPNCSSNCQGFLGVAQGGVSGNAQLNANGTYTETFTADGNEVLLFCNNSIDGNPAGPAPPTKITNLVIHELNNEREVNTIGELDITDSEDFPLTLTYAVSDGRDIESRFGDYSKTFDIPATKNNTRLLSHLQNANIVDNKDFTSLKKCRILVGQLEFFNGFIVVNGSKQTSKPDSYSCTILGGNYAWLTSIKNKRLCDIYQDGESLDFNYSDIWQKARYAVNADTTFSGVNYPYTYPLISYGDFWPNATASDRGKVNIDDQTEPSQDWRPAFYIYSLLTKIFQNIGYTISSDFINETEFKKLITVLPLNKQLFQPQGDMTVTRKKWNQDTSGQGDKGIWDSAVSNKDYQVIRAANHFTQGADSTVGDTDWQRIKFDTVINDPLNCYDSSTGEWTCPKSGFYDFSSSVHLIIGNYDNSENSANQVVTTDRISTADDYCEVAININVTDATGNDIGLSSFIDYDTPAAQILGGCQLGNWETSANSPSPYASTRTPVLIAVKREISTPYTWYIEEGQKVSTNVKVRFTNDDAVVLNVNPSQVKWGYVSLADPNRTALTGMNGMCFWGSFPTDSYYGGNSNGLIPNDTFNNDTFNVKEIYERNSLPYFSVTPAQSPASLTIGNSYPYSELLPCDIDQVQFIKGVSHLFNLQFRTDAQLKTVYIEPYDNFYKDKTLAYDWNQKVDYSTEITDVYNVGLSEELSIEYRNDGSDGLMSFINNAFRENESQFHFFNYFEVIGDKFTKGIKKIVNPVFASTWCDWDADLSGASGANPKLVPIINKTQSIFGYGVLPYPTRPDKILGHAPRVLKWKGWKLGDNHSSFMTKWNFRRASANYGSAWSPRATFVDWESTSTEKFGNLSFDDEVINPPTTSTVETVEGLYTLYYKNMINQLKSKPRTRTYSVKLSNAEMLTIDLSRLVYIDNTYWKINKIIDYSPVKDVFTRVELIEWTENFSQSDRT